MRNILIVISALLSFISIAKAEYQPLNLRIEESDSKISIVSYNVENLFDTKHDPGKEDWEFLPLKNTDGSPNQDKLKGCNSISNESRRKQCMGVDWTDDKLQIKLQKISQVLNLQGALPDVLALVEVENASVLGLLADTLGYSRQNLYITTGNDERGINVAVLFKNRVLEYHSHGEAEVKDEAGLPLGTRKILVINLKVKGSEQIIGIYVNHWPSQGNDVKDRVAAAKALNGLIDQQTKKIGANYHSIAVGDFNVTQYDRPHAIIEMIEGRENGLKDALTILKKADENTFYQLPIGTSYFTYGNTWDNLDKILVSQSLLENKSLIVVKDSFRILAFNETSNSYDVRNPLRHAFGNILQRIPNRYNFKSETADKAGFSDHYPVRILLEHRTK
jgi:endonuclease/exonuclease/phosphatase family metal-dependent hydrolase